MEEDPLKEFKQKLEVLSIKHADIAELTDIARELVQFADSIVACVTEKLKRTGRGEQKLALFYFIDSVCKTSRNPFDILFGNQIDHLFCYTFASVGDVRLSKGGDTLRGRLIAMKESWHGNQMEEPLFDPRKLSAIDQFLARTQNLSTVSYPTADELMISGKAILGSVINLLEQLQELEKRNLNKQEREVLWKFQRELNELTRTLNSCLSSIEESQEIKLHLPEFFMQLEECRKVLNLKRREQMLWFNKVEQELKARTKRADIVSYRIQRRKMMDLYIQNNFVTVNPRPREQYFSLSYDLSAEISNFGKPISKKNKQQPCKDDGAPFVDGKESSRKSVSKQKSETVEAEEKTTTKGDGEQTADLLGLFGGIKSSLFGIGDQNQKEHLIPVTIETATESKSMVPTSCTDDRLVEDEQASKEGTGDKEKAGHEESAKSTRTEVDTDVCRQSDVDESSDQSTGGDGAGDVDDKVNPIAASGGDNVENDHQSHEGLEKDTPTTNRGDKKPAARRYRDLVKIMNQSANQSGANSVETRGGKNSTPLELDAKEHNNHEQPAGGKKIANVHQVVVLEPVASTREDEEELDSDINAVPTARAPTPPGVTHSKKSSSSSDEPSALEIGDGATIKPSFDENSSHDRNSNSNANTASTSAASAAAPEPAKSTNVSQPKNLIKKAPVGRSCLKRKRGSGGAGKDDGKDRTVKRVRFSL
ncbi:uncharacterized protein LODBEIA_P01430 [Lodderomyces beijingensis]|uniref:CID domain-containing protein n=1 Tax=Lodderomyces beijingensis TaxID=1775926 RepID=A0ABP0ZCL6_9ASCO